MRETRTILHVSNYPLGMQNTGLLESSCKPRPRERFPTRIATEQTTSVGSFASGGCTFFAAV